MSRETKTPAAAVSTGKEHRLHSPWSFYFVKKLNRGENLANYEKNLTKLGQVNSIESFWRMYSNLQSPDAIPKDHDLFLMRQQLIPAWESFPNGGCWILKVRKRNGIINRLWEELLFATVAELFDEADLVGVGVATRTKEDVISVWNRDNTVKETHMKIGEKLKSILNLDHSTQVEYKPFRMAIQDGSSFRNAKPYFYAATNLGQKTTPPSQDGSTNPTPATTVV